MQPGDSIEINALHADRVAYRWWRATLEAVNGPELIVSWPIGTHFGAPQPPGEKISKLQYREYYWLDRHWNIAAGYNASGEFERIYADVTSLPWIEGNVLYYIDHELDVERRRGERAVIADEDEFEAAIATYGYTPDFQTHCRAATEELRRIVDAWQPAERFDLTPVPPQRHG